MTQRHKDSIYVALAHHVYSTQENTDHQPPAGWNILEVCNHLESDGYYGTAYLNQSTQQIIIASRGMDLPNQNPEPSQKEKQSSFTWVGTRFKSLKNSFNELQSYSQNVNVYINSVMQLMLSSQQISALEFALDIKKKYPQYQLSFAGHSMGGWLSQIVVYHFMVMQEKTQDASWATWCITLDSPGAKNILEEMHARYMDVIPNSKLATFLERLDITTYLSSPNLINTCNTHLGTLRRLYPKLNSGKIANAFFYTIESHRVETLAAQFDSETGYPKVCTKIVDWPKVQWDHEEASLDNPIESLLSKINDNLPGVRLPDFLVSLAGKALDAGVKKLIDSSRVTRGFYALTQVMMDVMAGRVDQAEYAGFFQFANERNCYEPTQDLNFHEQYEMAHQYHYAVEPINLRRLHLRNVSPKLRRFIWSYAQPGEIQRLQTQLVDQNINANVWQDFAAFQLLTGSLVQKKGWEIELKGDGQETIGEWRERVEDYLTKYPALITALSAQVTQQAELLYEVKTDLKNVKEEVTKLAAGYESIDNRVAVMEQGYRYRELSAEERTALQNKAQQRLVDTYKAKIEIQGVFGKPFKLEGQYLNVQMLYQSQILEESDLDISTEELSADSSSSQTDDSSNVIDTEENSSDFKMYRDNRISSFEDLFGKKMALEITQLFSPAKEILRENQKTNEENISESPHFLFIQGRAGIGKSTFVDYIQRQWALKTVWPQFEWVFVLRLRDLREQRFAVRHERGEVLSLADWVYYSYYAGHLELIDFKTLWQQVIEPQINDKVLFILDGYDEVPDEHPCQDALATLLKSSVHKIITSRPTNTEKLPKNRRDLEIMGFDDDNVTQYIQFYFSENETKAATILSALRTNLSLWGNAHIPVILNLLCGVLEQAEDLDKNLKELGTMSGIYQSMEEKLLERAYRKENEKRWDKECKHLSAQDKTKIIMNHYEKHRHVLAHLAFVAFNNQQLVIPAEALNQVLIEEKIELSQRSHFINELLGLGLLKSVIGDASNHERAAYEFLHLTFQEYYAACYIPWGISKNPGALAREIGKIKLNPRYQILLWFIAGQLKHQPEAFKQYIELLQAEPRDLLGHYELGLVLRCVDEAWEVSQSLGIIKPLQEKVQLKIQGLWESRLLLKGATVPFFVQVLRLSANWTKATGPDDIFVRISMPTYGSLQLEPFSAIMDAAHLTNFLMWSQLISPKILAYLADPPRWVHKNYGVVIPVVISTLGPAAATPEIIAALVAQLREHKRISLSAAHALVNLGITAVQPEILKGLLMGAVNPDPAIRSTSVRALSAFSADIVRSPDMLNILLPRLQDENVDVRISTLETISDLGTFAATPEILAKVATGMSDKDPAVRAASIYAIGCFGKTVINSDMLKQIEAGLRDNKFIVYCTTLKTIKMLGNCAVTPNIIAELLVRLREKGDIIQTSYAKATNALTSKALQQSLGQQDTRDHDRIKRLLLAQAIGALGTDIVNSFGFLDYLADSLGDKEEHVYCSALETVKALGPLAVTPEILSKLFAGMRHQNSVIRKLSIEAIGALGIAALTSDFSAQLLNNLRDANGEIRASAAYAIASIKVPELSNEMLESLIAVLCDKDQRVCQEAIAAIGTVGIYTINARILAQLSVYLMHPEPNIVYATAETIYKLGDYGFSPAILKNLVVVLCNHFSKVKVTTTQKVMGHVPYANLAVRYRILKQINQQAGILLLSQALQSVAARLSSPTFVTPETSNEELLGILMASYLAGNISVAVVWQPARAEYALQGYADKQAFLIPLTPLQAQWLKHHYLTIQKLLDQGKWDEVSLDAIEKGEKAWLGQLAQTPQLPNIMQDPLLTEYQAAMAQETKKPILTMSSFQSQSSSSLIPASPVKSPSLILNSSASKGESSSASSPATKVFTDIHEYLIGKFSTKGDASAKPRLENFKDFLISLLKNPSQFTVAQHLQDSNIRTFQHSNPFKSDRYYNYIKSFEKFNDIGISAGLNAYIATLSAQQTFATHEREMVKFLLTSINEEKNKQGLKF